MSPTRLSRCLLLICSLALLAGGAALAQPAPAPPAPPPPPEPPTIAVINGKPLTVEAFNAAMADAFARQIFEALLHRRLVFDEAARLGITLTRVEFEERVKTAKGTYGDEAQFQAGLRHLGVTEAWYLQQLKTDMLLDRILDKRETIPDAEVAAYYDKHKDEFVRPASVYLWDFATADLEQAYAMAKRLSQGEKLSETAEGLTVGWVTRAEIADPLLRDTAFTLEIGQASNPVQVEGTYHVLYVSEAQPGLNRSLAQAREDVVKALRKEKGLTRESVVDALVRDARIQINWDPLRYLNAEYLMLKQTRILVDGKPVLLPRPAYVVGGRLMIPAKPVAQAMGAKLTWQAQSSTLVAERGAAKVTFTVGKPMALVSSQPMMTVAPRIEGGTLMVESRTLVEGLGCTVQWEPMVNTVYIKTTKP